uniref:RNA binding motif protein 26 n=1 Tax=Scleropages formosus TaxID=113540 RepID=A0A8C9V9R1_SCLFO
MIIEDLDALKSWLSKTLEPICDADPSALAKYVLALVKKDKKEKELKALCVDQLDVFLQKETQTFVDKLFEAINSKSYLPQYEQISATIRTEDHQRQVKDDLRKEEVIFKVFFVLLWLMYKRLPDSPHLFCSASRYEMLFHFENDNVHFKTFERRGDERKKDDRFRKWDYDRIPSRRDSYRDRYNRRRGRSYSRSRSRSWSKDRPRDRERSRSRSRSSKTGRSKYDHERPLEPMERNTPASLVPDVPSSHFPVPTISSTITVIAPKHHGNSSTETWSEFPEDSGPPQRKRCRDYDEKGFCMRGDMCPFDHGNDPVVVEDVNLPSMLPFQAQPLTLVDTQPPPGLPPPQTLVTPPPVNLRPPVPLPETLPPSLPPVAGLPPPLLPLQPSGMDAPPNSVTSTVPNIVTSGMRLPPPQVPPRLFSPGMGIRFPEIQDTSAYEADVYNPEAPSITSMSRPVYRHRVHAQRPNLIGLTMGEMDPPHRENTVNNNSVRIVVESDRRKRSADPADGALAKKLRPGFNKPNHQIFYRRVPFGSQNAKLYVRQIPAELNNIAKLNGHFSKFGTIVNLQVAYQNDPTCALVEFSTHEEAKRAILSTEAVLNNRFIKVHWHREDSAAVVQQPPQHPQTVGPQSVKQSVKDRLGPLPNTNSDVPQEIQNVEKISVKSRLGFSSKSTAGVPVFSPSTGLKKTVYNSYPSVLKATLNSVPFVSTVTSAETLKKKHEAFRLQQDVLKKKQEILEKHIETQKLLISKLEKNKTLKREDKAQIMETLTTLTTNITKLQAEIKDISSPMHLKPTKSKAEAQKELLDTELDLYKKAQAGEDTTELRARYTQLQLAAAKRGILASGRGRGASGHGQGALRGRGRGIRGRGRGAPAHAVVDHRPRALEVSGFIESDKVDLLPHFAQFGEIEDCQIDDSTNCAVITFRTRAEAELAAVHGVKFNSQDLKLAWHKPTAPLTPADAEEAEAEDEEVSTRIQSASRLSALTFFVSALQDPFYIDYLCVTLIL